MNSKIALITDTHFGARNDSPLFADFFLKFYDEVFFPTLIDRGITHVVHLGDLFDRRKFVNFHVLNKARVHMLDRLQTLGMTIHVLVGNHDAYFKNTNGVNAVTELCARYPNIHIYSEPEEVVIEGLPILFVPWLNSENMERGIAMIQSSDAPVLMGHLEINGFLMHKGSYCEGGLQRNLFGHYDVVYSGHFHSPSKEAHIEYLGAPYEMTMQDAGEDRGFHIFDTTTYAKELIPNPHRMHYRIIYDDRDPSAHAIRPNEDVEVYRDRYVKILVAHKTAPHLFERWVDSLYAANPAGVSILENLDVQVAQDLDLGLDPLEATTDSEPLAPEDTLILLHAYVDSISDLDGNSRGHLKDIVGELYIEAVNTTDQAE